MGYTTEFQGRFEVVEKGTGAPATLSFEQIEYLKAFSDSRRMKRNEFKAVKREDPRREVVGLPVGEEGCYFVADNYSTGTFGISDVVGHNEPPKGQPGLWCQWVPTEDGTAIVWDEGEKFYKYEEWLNYILVHFLGVWGLGLEGSVKWRGEDSDDTGILRVTDINIVISEGKA